MDEYAMTGAWTANDAVIAAHEALAVLGIGQRQLHLLRLGENALYRILGTDLLLRVARPGTTPEDVYTIIAAAAKLRANGVPVCEPAVQAHPDGPIFLKDCVVSVWKYYTEIPGASTDFGEFGRALKNLHVNSAEIADRLPSWNPLEITRRRLRAVSEIGVPLQWINDLIRRVEEFQEELSIFEPILSSGVIHGDAHAGNVLNSEGGIILIDLDNLAIGSREADFAPTIVQLRRFELSVERWTEFTRGYGLRDSWALQESPLVRLRELFMIVWLLQQYGNSEDVDRELELRMSSLDDKVDKPTKWNAK
ncbi:MAG: phosphotransferase enzyme family protein [Pseudonocardiaceae bacterium]